MGTGVSIGALLRLLALVAIACAISALPASAAEPTKRALTFDVVVGPGNDVPCTITADLYTPAGASKAHPVPAVMGTNGFGGSKSDFSTLGPAYAKRGYAFFAYSGLGFGNSGCKITLDDPDYDDGELHLPQIERCPVCGVELVVPLAAGAPCPACRIATPR